MGHEPLKGAGGLLPCPFCGGAAVRLPMLDNGGSPVAAVARATRFVGCRRCCVASFARVTEDECLAAWNRRAR